MPGAPTSLGFHFGGKKTHLSFKPVTELSGCVLYEFVNVKTMRSLGSFQSALTVWSVCVEPDLEGGKQTFTDYLLFASPVLSVFTYVILFLKITP